MNYAGHISYCSENNVESMFAQFKREHTFDTWQQALSAMDRFMHLVRSHENYRESLFLQLMERQCQEAIAEAEQNPEAAAPKEALETVEWHIDPCGVALERRLYDLTGADPLTVLASPVYRFPADYIPYVLGISRDRNTVNTRSFKEMTGAGADEFYYIVRSVPRHAYTGNPRALSKLKLDEGAFHYCTELCRSEYTKTLPWPQMCATKRMTRLFG